MCMVSKDKKKEEKNSKILKQTIQFNYEINFKNKC